MSARTSYNGLGGIPVGASNAKPVRLRQIDGLTVQRIGQATLLTDGADYAVVAKYKDGDGEYIKLRGTWDECDDYADRNESPDNPERYTVMEVIA